MKLGFNLATFSGLNPIPAGIPYPKFPLLPDLPNIKTAFKTPERNLNLGGTKPIPQHWERLGYKVGDEPLRVLHAPVRGAKDCIYVILGKKDTVEENVSNIRYANKLGKSVITLELPDYGKDVGYMEFFRELGECFRISDIPLFADYERHHNMSHSTGGYLEMELMMDDGASRELCSRSTSATFISPYTTASFAESVWKTLTFNARAGLYPDSRYGETRADRLHARFQEMRGQPPAAPPEQNLTPRQVQYMQDECSPLLERIERDSFPLRMRNRPSLVVIGGKDFVSAPRASHIIADSMGAKKSFHRQGWHRPHVERSNARRAIFPHIDRASGATLDTVNHSIPRTRILDDDQPPASESFDFLNDLFTPA